SLRRADHQRPRTPPPPTAESRIPPGRDPAANEQRPRTPPPPTAESRIPPGRDPALGGGAVRVWNGAVPASALPEKDLLRPRDADVRSPTAMSSARAAGR